MLLQIYFLDFQNQIKKALEKAKNVFFKKKSKDTYFEI